LNPYFETIRQLALGRREGEMGTAPLVLDAVFITDVPAVRSGLPPLMG
jgi:hypothetical protein